jgi:hypothetical protein
LEAGRHGGLLARGSARLQYILVQQVLKLRLTGLIARGVGVGQVIGNVIHIELLRDHSASGAEQSTDHIELLEYRSESIGW